MHPSKKTDLNKEYSIALKAFNAIIIPTIVINKEHRITHINRALERLAGIKAQDYIGTDKHWSFFYPEKRKLMADFLIDNAAEEEIKKIFGNACHKSRLITGAYEGEIPTNTQTGEILWIKFTASPLKNEEGETVAAIETFEDIGARKKPEHLLRESEEKFQKAFYSSPTPMSITTLEDGVYVDVNNEFLDLVERKKEEILGHTSTEIGLWTARNRKEFAADMEKGENLKGEITFATKTKKTKSIIWSSELLNLGGRKHVLFNAIDITKRKKTEQELRESEEKYRTFFENTLAGVYQSSHKGRYVSANNVYAHMLGYDSPKDLIDSVTDISRQVYADPHERKQSLPILLENLGGTFISKLRRKDGRLIWISNHVKVFKDPATGEIFFNGVAVDITEKRNAEEALRESEERYRTLVDTQIESISRWLPDTTLTYANDEYCRLLGVSKKAILGKKWMEYVPADAQDKAKKIYMDLTDNPRVHRYEHKSFGQNNIEKWEEWIDSPIFDVSGRLVEFQSVGRDITERKKAEQKLLDAVKEKELLLKEVHHRVKNNLQVISSLLNLQKTNLKNSEDMKVFLGSQNYIKSMALVHEKLHKSGDLSGIEFGSYLKDLTEHLLRAFGVDSNIINVGIDSEDVFLDVDSAIPCGLIVNELVSNSLKHAFPDGRKGTIGIGLKKYAGGEVWLSVSDDGAGFPETLDFRNVESLGLQIVTTLVGQLHGEIELTKREGAKFTIKFKT